MVHNIFEYAIEDKSKDYSGGRRWQGVCRLQYEYDEIFSLIVGSSLDICSSITLTGSRFYLRRKKRLGGLFWYWRKLLCLFNFIIVQPLLKICKYLLYIFIRVGWLQPSGTEIWGICICSVLILCGTILDTSWKCLKSHALMQSRRPEWTRSQI